MTLSSTWPFDARRVPFFYGWVIWLLSTVGLWMTIPGQTMGMAVFTDFLIVELDLSRTQLSTAYLLGTVGSSLLLTRAGRLYDRHGARTMMVLASAGLGLCVVYITCIGPVSRWTVTFLPVEAATLSFVLISLGYFGVRMMGQGILAGANRNILLVWFDRRRGMASGARGVFMSLGFSIAPLVIAALIDAVSWRAALWLMAAATGIGFGLLALVFARDTPESCGLRPDGEPHEPQDRPRTVTAVNPVNMTLSEARRTVAFWVYSLSLAMYSLAGTAVTFHVVDIFEEAGRTRDEAFGYFLPLAIVSVSVNLVSSWWSDKTSLKPMLLLMLTGFVAGSAGLTGLDTQFGYYTVVAGYGVGAGLWAALSSLAYVRFFGRRHLGEISGSGVSLSVAGSAIGPALFSAGKDLTGTYTSVAWLCGGIFIVLLVTGAFVVKRDAPPRRAQAAQAV